MSRQYQHASSTSIELSDQLRACAGRIRTAWQLAGFYLIEGAVSVIDQSGRTAGILRAWCRLCVSVMTGMHHLTLPLDLIFISGYGYTMLWPLLALCNIAQASSALGMYVLQYKDARIRNKIVRPVFPVIWG